MLNRHNTYIKIHQPTLILKTKNKNKFSLLTINFRYKNNTATFLNTACKIYCSHNMLSSSQSEMV